MTVFTLYMATIVFCAVAILVVFELIDQRLPTGSSSARRPANREGRRHLSRDAAPAARIGSRIGRT